MAVEPLDHEAVETNSYVELTTSLLSQWKVWLLAVCCLGVALMALRPASEAPGGYVPFFLTLAVGAAVFAVERAGVLPSPIQRVWHY